jgi:hypothetical protein
VGIEVKATTRWRSADGSGLRDLHERGVITHAIGVFGGPHAQKDGPVTVVPVTDFLGGLSHHLRG